MVDRPDAAGNSRDRLSDLPAWLRLAISHLNVFRAIRVTLKRLFAAEMESFGPRLAGRPLARTEGRWSVVEQTRDIENFLFCIAHHSYLIDQSVALRNRDACAATNISNKMRQTNSV